MKPTPAPSAVYDRWAPRLVLFVLFAAPLAFCLDLQDTFDLPKLALVYTVDILLAGLWAWQALDRGQWQWRRTPLDIPILVFLGAAAVSAWRSIDPALSVFGAYRIYVFGWLPMLSFALLFAFTAQVTPSASFRKRLVWTAMMSAALAGLYAILQETGNELFERMPVARGTRVWSSLGNPIYLGALCMMAAPLVLAEIMSASTLAAILPVGALVVGGLVLSLSRGAWLGTAVACAVMVFALWRGQRSKNAVQTYSLRRGCWFIAALVVIGALMPSVRRRAAVQFSTQESSNAARIEGWKAGLKVWRQYPFLGSGPDTFFQAFRPYRSMSYIRATGTGVTQADAHNDVIQIASTQGSVGLICFFWILWALARAASKDPASISLAAPLLALFIQNQFNFSSVSTCVWAATLTALIVPSTLKSARHSWAKSTWHFLGVLVVAGGILAFWGGVVRPVGANLMYSVSLGLAQQGRQKAALEVLRRAVGWNPSVELYSQQRANAARTLAAATIEPMERQKLFDESWAAADESVRRHPHNPDAWNNRGVAAMWLTQLAGQHQESQARQSFEEAARLDPVFVDAWANLAKWEHLAGHLDQEKMLWKKVLELDPAHAMARQVLGLP